MSVAGPPFPPFRKFAISLDELLTWDIGDHLEGYILFHPKFDFTEACSCDQCSHKLAELKDFEEELKSRRHLVKVYEIRLQHIEDQCMVLSGAAEWTKRMLDLLYTNLRAVYKKLGASWTLKKSKSAANLEKADLDIVKLLSQSELIMDLEIVEASEEALDYPEKNEIEDLSLRINAGFFYYGHAQVKDKAYVLLQEIQDIEKQHDKAKKSAEAENKPLPPSISMKYIEDQIKLVKDFPVDGLLHEVEEVIAEISPVSNHRKMLREARDYIYDTSGAMVRERIEFWRKFHSLTSKGNGQDHSSNGLNETLDSLLNKFNSFKEQWEEKYAPFFTPHDRSDPKRQRIEQ